MPTDVRKRYALPSSLITNSGLRPNKWAQPKIRIATCRKTEGLPHIGGIAADSSSGYGVHWPDLDEDIGVQGLLLGKRSSESRVRLNAGLECRNEKLNRDAA